MTETGRATARRVGRATIAAVVEPSGSDAKLLRLAREFHRLDKLLDELNEGGSSDDEMDATNDIWWDVLRARSSGGRLPSPEVRVPAPARRASPCARRPAPAWAIG